MAKRKKTIGLTVAKPKRKRTVTAKTSTAATKNVNKAKKQTKRVRKTTGKLSTPYFQERREMFESFDDTCDGSGTEAQAMKAVKKVIKRRCANKKKR